MDFYDLYNFLEDEFDDDLLLLLQHQQQGGSRPGKAPNRFRGNSPFLSDYFGERPLFSEQDFRRRYRMRKSLFQKIVNDAMAFDPYFQQKMDAFGIPGIHPYVKVGSSLHMMAYNSPADALEEYFRLAESTAMESFERFINFIVIEYGPVYLGQLSPEELERLLQEQQQRGLPGCYGSLDCTHFRWSGCPTAFHGSYLDRNKVISINAEAVAGKDGRFSHAFIGSPGSLNDINVLGRSTFLNHHASLPHVAYSLQTDNGLLTFQEPYVLVDGIYPNFRCLVSAAGDQHVERQAIFQQHHESVRKDVERAFGMLKKRFPILNDIRLHRHEVVLTLIKACFILHNMIIEDERGQDLEDILATLPDDAPFIVQRQRVYLDDWRESRLVV